MQYINKTVSCYEVINKVQRTFRPQGSSWIKDAIENIGWGIQAIGYHAGFIDKSTPYPYLKVSNHRAKIPCDVERIKLVEMLVPTNNIENMLNPSGKTPYQEFLQDELNPDSTEPDDDNNDAQERAVIDFEEDGIITSNFQKFQSVKLRLGSDETAYGLYDSESPRTTKIQPNAPYYNLNDDYVITSFETGLIKLHYVGFILDKKGYPKIIDDFNYKTCLEWYVFAQMILGGYKHPEVDWKTANSMFETYKLRAENSVKMLSIDGAARFKAGWSRYVQNNNIEKDFFMNNEQPVFIDEG